MTSTFLKDESVTFSASRAFGEFYGESSRRGKWNDAVTMGDVRLPKRDLGERP